VVVHLVAARTASLELFIFLVAGLALVLCVLFGVRRSSIAGDAPEASGVSLRNTEIQAASVVSLQIAIYLGGFASNSTDSIVGLILLVVPHMLAL
jgi:predicted cobalt transporter CbtA